MKLIFFIAFRYLWSKKNTHSVSVILYISLLAFIITSTAMFVIMSVFSGFREIYFNQLFHLNPDLKIEAKNQKFIPNFETVYFKIRKNPNIEFISRVIEEKVYLMNHDKNQVAFLIGVDKNYNKIIPIDSCMYFGNYLNFINQKEMVISLDLFYSLTIPLNQEETSTIYMPKKGKSLISNFENAFVTQELYTTGIVNETFFNTIISPIENVEHLLEKKNIIASNIILKVKKNKNPDDVKLDLEKKLGKQFLIKNRLEQDNSYIKLTNIEQLFTYLIFILIVFLSSFNLAGAIIVLIIDKNKQNQTLSSIGLFDSDIKKIYFILGLLVTFISSVIGIIIGLIIVLIQSSFMIIISGGNPYPVKIEFFNVLLVFFTLMICGTLISWIVSRKLLYNF